MWRRKRDSNPRGLSPKRFSRPPRYDRFDIPPRCMPGKNNTNRGQDAVFLTNTALRSRLRHKVLTRSRALSLPENTASDSQATKSSIFPMIFGKNERSCTLPYYKRVFAKRRGNCGDLARLVLLLPGISVESIAIIAYFVNRISKIVALKSVVVFGDVARDVFDHFAGDNKSRDRRNERKRARRRAAARIHVVRVRHGFLFHRFFG